MHPPQAAGLGGFFEGLPVVAATVLLALVGWTALDAWAAVADRGGTAEGTA